ncbi:MAG: hypothetical protein KJ046_16735 [Anaerolineae bacterium]|nr:hypothetical protein [Anaerolineae bacterium]
MEFAELERGYDSSSRVTTALGRVAGGGRFHWLIPPVGRYPVTIMAVHAAADPTAHRAAALAMAETTWATWQEYHTQVAAWAAALGLG